MYQSQQWNSETIKQHEKDTGQALLKDEQQLVSFSRDFSNLVLSPPNAVCLPQDTDSLQASIVFAKQHSLPLTIRGKGLSQGGQSLPVPGGVTLSMQHFDKVLELVGDTLWVEANCSWSELLKRSLAEAKAPYVLPYNCNLSVAGVLSVGGVGASSFKFGAINAYVSALEVVDGSGEKQLVDKNAPLFYACLAGQGRCAVITKACIQLRPVLPQVKTWSLIYSSRDQWLEDVEKLRDKVDYMELFCSPALVGAKLKEGRRHPLAQWLYVLHISVEYEGRAPELKEITGHLNPWELMNTQEEGIHSYFLRHDFRFELMKRLGQWELLHPWYECFIPTRFIKDHLGEILERLPLYYANLVHVVPIKKQKAGFLMFPEEESICSLMILNPGVPEILKEGCIEAIEDLDSWLLKEGGKRYLSGFLGKKLPCDYWSTHFGSQYDLWVEMKKKYDPMGIFSSMLYPSYRFSKD